MNGVTERWSIDLIVQEKNKNWKAKTPILAIQFIPTSVTIGA